MSHSHLIVALDYAHVEQAQALVMQLGNEIDFYKMGLELAYSGGLALVPWLKARGKKVFLDLKLHDIPQTVERATAQIARLGVEFLTVHAYPQTMQAAQGAVRGGALKILAVTVLTSQSQTDISEMGFTESLTDLVSRRARQAKAAGVSGLILSPQELTLIRPLVGNDMLLVTPGIRPEGTERGDQKRVMTVGAARKAGADYLVIGRPITQAHDPHKAAQTLRLEWETAT